MEVFSTKVMPNVWALLRATTPQALQEAQAAMTAGLTVLPWPCARQKGLHFLILRKVQL